MTAKTRTDAKDRRAFRAMAAALRSAALVWVALVGLLGAALAFAYGPLGRWVLPVTLGAAALQVALVLAFFMDLRRAGVLIRLTVMAAVLFTLVMFALTFNDLFHRF